MTAVAPRRSRSAARRWTALLGLSVLFHAAVLGGLSLGFPISHVQAQAPAMAVTLVDPPPFVRPQLAPAPPAAKPTPVRPAVIADVAPRYAVHAAQAATGDTPDAVDLFGPVFADGMWPRPVVVKSEPCDPKDVSDLGKACRRELLLIGLASGAPAGSNPRP